MRDDTFWESIVEAIQRGEVDAYDLECMVTNGIEEWIRESHAEAARRFRLLIADGLESGESRQLTDDVVGELRGRALGPEGWFGLGGLV